MSFTHADDISLPIDDVRAIVRLLANIAKYADSPLKQKQKLIQGLTELIDAEYWVWNLMRFDPHEAPFALSIMHNLPDKALAAITSSNHNLPDNPVNKEIIALATSHHHFTRTRNQLVDNEQFKQTRLYLNYYKYSGLGDSITSVYPTQAHPNVFSFVNIFRKQNKPAFTERDALITHIITSEIPWLHEPAQLQNDGTMEVQLPPRLQNVLTLLMDGLTPKRIANSLGLTENTIRTYIRHIYKHYNVSSRVELTRRFTHGDGQHKHTPSPITAIN